MVAHYLSTTRGPDWLKAFIDHGYIPVDIFLILSGFVLGMTYGGYFRGAVTAGNIARFLVYRLARIYPLMAVTSLVCVAEMLCGLDVWGAPGTSVGTLVANLLLVQAWWGAGHSLNAPAWSISTEWAANLLFPLLVVVLLRMRWRIAGTVAGGAFVALCVWALLHGQLDDADPWRGAIDWISGPSAILRCVAAFILGMVCWRLHHEGRTGWLGSTPVLSATVAIMLALTIYSWLDLPLVLLACALVLGLAAERSPVAAVLGSAVPRWSGIVSFSLYLWQIPLLPLRAPAITLAERMGAGDPWLVGNLVAMAGVLAVSELSFRWLERPLQGVVRSAFDRRFQRMRA